MINEEIPKHKKKKNKVAKKTNHKHEYKGCLLADNENYIKVDYCTICGKIKFTFTSCFETEPIAHGLLKFLNNAEIKEKYKDLEEFKVDDVYNVKFIKIK